MSKVMEFVDYFDSNARIWRFFQKYKGKSLMKTESLITIYMYDSKKWFTRNVYGIVFCKQVTPL